ncbi:tannase/feruloyl esterase family alpha/beta hydrolase [Blastomonas fulva]|uniref:tannase/feruloyl esterase family alpha/beta hydrolase n=1 Tax=Blastomonas fulva TaxID=1550728 RepID=UPI003F72CF03
MAISRNLIAIAMAPLLVSATPEKDAKGQCDGLAQADLSLISAAPTRIVRTSLVETSSGGYCEVDAYVAPRVRLGMRLPISRWNHKLLFQGCGGFCGDVDLTRADDALNRGYAVSTTDMGHRSTALDGLWAYGSTEAKRDFADRATHVATLASKAIVERFYGRSAERSYFRGCSTGGRQGLIAAQRYPTDFDGIVVGAPPLYYLRGTGVQLLSSVKAGRALDASDVRLLSESVMAVCDGIDGQRDGVIADPRVCRFDPDVLTCRKTSDRTCLASAKVEAIKRIYSGPVGSSADPDLIRGPELGSELNWIGTYIPSGNGSPAAYQAFIGDLFRYLAFDPDAGPTWTIDDFDMTADLPRLQARDSMFSADNPDISAFVARGGKLLHYHGWADQSVVPASSLRYATEVSALKASQAVDRAYRLFMVPGMNHCIAGPTIQPMDYLSALEDWVERDKPPQQFVIRRQAPNNKDLKVLPEQAIPAIKSAPANRVTR